MWYISNYVYIYNFYVSQVEKTVCPWCELLSHRGVQFHEVLESLVWIGCLLRKSARGSLKYTLRNRGGARVRCPGFVSRWREADSVEVSG